MEKYEQVKKNKEMEARIAKEEEEDNERIRNGGVPKKVIDQMRKEANAVSHQNMNAIKKKERVKDLGGRKNQTPKPTGNGAKQKGK